MCVQKLSYNGNLLCDDDVIGDVIPDGATIDLTLMGKRGEQASWTFKVFRGELEDSLDTVLTDTQWAMAKEYVKDGCLEDEMFHNLTTFLSEYVEREKIQIFFKVEGKTHTLDLHDYEKVSFVKELIKDITGIEPPEQCLSYGGKVLEDDNTLDDYSIENECEIIFEHKVRGGGPALVFGTIDGRNAWLMAETGQRITGETFWSFDTPPTADDLNELSNAELISLAERAGIAFTTSQKRLKATMIEKIAQNWQSILDFSPVLTDAQAPQTSLDKMSRDELLEMCKTMGITHTHTHTHLMARRSTPSAPKCRCSLMPSRTNNRRRVFRNHHHHRRLKVRLLRLHHHHHHRRLKVRLLRLHHHHHHHHSRLKVRLLRFHHQSPQVHLLHFQSSAMRQRLTMKLSRYLSSLTKARPSLWMWEPTTPSATSGSKYRTRLVVKSWRFHFCSMASSSRMTRPCLIMRL